jgi:DNA modification methylase
MPESLIRQILITTGKPVQTEIIYCGDCQRVLPQAIPDRSVDLIYVDPPFFSNQDYEVLWGDGYELRAFDDRWKGGIENYIAWMEPKIRECHRVLRPTGSFYLHCDWHAVHHLKVMADQIFGVGNFRSEIIWQRTSSHNDPKNFGNIADYILYYVKSNKFTWNKQYVSYTEDYLERFYRHVDEKGRRYRIDNLRSPHPRPNLTYTYKGYKPHPNGWAMSLEKMKEFDEAGLLEFPKSKDGRIQFRRYLDVMPGQPLQNIWTDIPAIHAHSRERLGFPTQKPEGLLERIIQASSKAEDVILDPMCGCGTSVAVAQKLGRHWVGIDVSPTACKLIFDRMRKISVPGLKIEGLPKTIDEVKMLQPFEFQNWVCQKVFAHVSERKVGDMGIDGWMMDGRPLQVKQSDSVGRNVVDNFETAIKRVKKNRGIIVALSFGKGAYEEVARVKNADGVEIELKTVEDIMREI